MSKNIISGMKIKMVPIGKVKPYKNNPRININGVNVVMESIKRFGFNQPIVVDKKMVIIAGHTRLKAAKKLKLSLVPVMIASNLTNKEAKAYRIADNKVTDYTGWNYELLIKEISDLEDMFIAFDEKELKKMLDVETVNTNKELDKISFDSFDHICPKCGFEYD